MRLQETEPAATPWDGGGGSVGHLGVCKWGHAEDSGVRVTTLAPTDKS